jgi:hypothetical protein
MGAGDFDLAFITPMVTYGVRYAAEQANLKERSKRNSKMSAAPETMNPLTEFRNWAEYVGEYQPIMMLRARPKLAESFMSAFGRGLAASRGMYAGPARLHFKTAFYQMRVFCGETQVTPIHPGKVERRVAASNAAVRVNDATYEGLYIFRPEAIGPHCGVVRVELFSEKEPNKAAESKTVSPQLIQRIWDDFAPFRTAVTVGGQ